VAMACFVGVAELPVSHSHHLFLIEALVGDWQWHSFCKTAAVAVCVWSNHWALGLFCTVVAVARSNNSWQNVTIGDWLWWFVTDFMIISIVMIGS
jgi:hypothetical protein